MRELKKKSQALPLKLFPKAFPLPHTKNGGHKGGTVKGSPCGTSRTPSPTMKTLNFAQNTGFQKGLPPLLLIPPKGAKWRLG